MRTTFIVGFPGETEAEFEDLLAYVKSARFERLGVFPYSLEPDTPAARLPGHLSDEVKAERRDRIMEAQQAIAFEFNESLVGKSLDVLIDGPSRRMPRTPTSGSAGAMPTPLDVDGVVYVAAIEPGARRPRPLHDPGRRRLRPRRPPRKPHPRPRKRRVRPKARQGSPARRSTSSIDRDGFKVPRRSNQGCKKLRR